MDRDAALEAVFKPVRPPTTFEETVERLGTAIRLGILTPGMRLPAERELAGELGISRSTLRQALTTLVQSGHLVSQRGRTGGTFVAERPPLAEADAEPLGEEARAVLDNRVAVETRSRGPCRRAGRAGGPRPPRRPGREDGRRRATSRTTGCADIRFHIGLAEAARSPRLVTAMTEVQGQMSDLIARIAHPEQVLARSNEQHRRIVSDAAHAATPRVPPT